MAERRKPGGRRPRSNADRGGEARGGQPRGQRGAQRRSAGTRVEGGRARGRHAPAEDRKPSKHEPVHLGDEVVRELKSAARPGKGDILVKVFSDAVAAYAAGDLDDAIELGDQAKHMALRSTNAREFLGLAYYSAGRWQEAARELAAFRRIAGTDAQNPVLADCYRALGKPEKALELCDEIDPSSAEEAVWFEATIVAAGALGDMGRVDEAVSRLQRLDLDPGVAEEHHLRAWYVLADLLERVGRFTQARMWFESVASADAELTDAPERAARLAGS